MGQKYPGVKVTRDRESWRAVWFDSTGRRRRKRLGNSETMSRAEAERRALKLQQVQLICPGYRDGPAIVPTITAHVREYVTRRGPEIGDAARKWIEMTRAQLVACFGDVRLDALTRDGAGRLVVHLRQPRRDGTLRSEWSVKGYITVASRLFEDARKRDLIPINPFDRLRVKVAKIERDWRYVTLAELDRILAACPDASWRAFFGLLRLAGLRLGEARRLTWDRIDWERRTLTVVPREGKVTTKQRTRVVPVQPRLYALLREAFDAAAPGSRYVSPFCKKPNTVGREIVVRAGLTPWAKLFHTLRKNLVSDWQAVYPSLDVAAWLGHDVRVAADHYHQTLDTSIAAVTGEAAQAPAPAADADLRSEIADLRAMVSALVSQLRPAAGHERP